MLVHELSLVKCLQGCVNIPSADKSESLEITWKWPRYVVALFAFGSAAILQYFGFLGTEFFSSKDYSDHVGTIFFT